MYFPIDNDTTTKASAQGYTHHVSIFLAGTEPGLAQGKAVCIIVLEYGELKTFLHSLFNRKAVERRDVIDEQDFPAEGIHKSRHANTDPHHFGSEHFINGAEEALHDIIRWTVGPGWDFCAFQDFTFVKPGGNHGGSADINSDVLAHE